MWKVVLFINIYLLNIINLVFNNIIKVIYVYVYDKYYN